MAKRALGRGLGAIIGDVEEAYNQELSHDSSDLVREILIESIYPNPFQPRTHFDESALEELSRSIQKHGLLQPIIVIEKDDGYMLLAGERRLRATKRAGLERIKAIVADIASENLRELALIENIQREDLNPIELATAYQELIEEYDITQEGLSEIIHKSRAQITNTMRLLSLSSLTKQYIQEGKLSQGHAKIMVGLEPSLEERAVQTIIGQKLENKDEISPPEPLESIKNKITQWGYGVKLTKRSLTVLFKDESEMEAFLKRINH